MDIILLRPTIKETLWGGRRLIDDFGMQTDGDNAAEAWLLSCHKDGPSYAVGGEYDGTALADIIEKEGREVLGTHNADINGFPVLIKIIDACDRLSVQVHPGDEYARRVENENGKTEAWFVLSADDGAELIYGVNRNMTREQFAASIENGTLLENVNRVKVKPGDVVFIPSGMLHAIGAGILLAEVQQSSNTTYRVFDYDRRDKNGNKRELHVKKATDVVTLTKTDADFAPEGEEKQLCGATKRLLTHCRYFSMTELKADGDFEDVADETSFVSLLVLDGSGEISANGKTYALKKGSSVFIPASFGKYTLRGSFRALETRT